MLITSSKICYQLLKFCHTPIRLVETILHLTQTILSIKIRAQECVHSTFHIEAEICEI